MKVKKHMPNFDDGFYAPEFEFNRVEEFLAIPFIKDVATSMGFKRFSVSKQFYLMAEFRYGSFCTVGHSESDLSELGFEKFILIKESS